MTKISSNRVQVIFPLRLVTFPGEPNWSSRRNESSNQKHELLSMLRHQKNQRSTHTKINALPQRRFFAKKGCWRTWVCRHRNARTKMQRSTHAHDCKRVSLCKKLQMHLLLLFIWKYKQQSGAFANWVINSLQLNIKLSKLKETIIYRPYFGHNTKAIA